MYREFPLYADRSIVTSGTERRVISYTMIIESFDELVGTMALKKHITGRLSTTTSFDKVQLERQNKIKKKIGAGL